MSYVISPSVSNILSGDPSPNNKHRYNERQSQSKPKRESFWDKVKTFAKKAYAAVLSVLPLIPPILNAYSRYKETKHKSRSSNKRGWK
jgi:hypothetical protein